MQQCPGDGQQHAYFASPHAATRRGRRTHPLQRQNEQRRGDEVGHFDELRGRALHHDFLGPLALNIFSMRSVMRNPPTMLLVAATMAMVPRTVEKVVLCSP